MQGIKLPELGRRGPSIGAGRKRLDDETIQTPHRDQRDRSGLGADAHSLIGKPMREPSEWLASSIIDATSEGLGGYTLASGTTYRGDMKVGDPIDYNQP